MTTLIRYLLCAALLALTGCNTLETTPGGGLRPLQSLYDSQVIDPGTGVVLTLADVVSELAGADVVVIGEYHGHQGAHLLQSQLQQALYNQRPDQVLTLEQFAIDRQPALDRYVRGETGEREMMEDAEAWANYQASYRPLVEFAIANHLPVVAANAPAKVVRCIGRLGPDYLDTLPPEQRSVLPQQPFLSTEAYQDKFLTTMGGSRHDTAGQTRLMNSYHAQLLRDNTMASRILQAHQQNPGAQILHLTGTFHSESHLGTVAALHQRAPELTILVVSPVFTDQDGTLPDLDAHLDKGDLLYLLRPLPPEFRDSERQHLHFQEQFSNPERSGCTG